MEVKINDTNITVSFFSRKHSHRKFLSNKKRQRQRAIIRRRDEFE